MTWWQIIIVVWASALAVSFIVAMYWEVKTKYIKAFNQTRPRTIFERGENNGEKKQ